MNHLGEKYTFSAEVPYGYEDERVMHIAYKIYPALRNRMPEPFLKELDRASKALPHPNDKEYVQWQRGPLHATPLDLMKSWVDTAAANKDTWLVLVFHGIDSLGWEWTPIPKLEEYFKYIKAREPQLWIATFGDVTKYIREREHAHVQTTANYINSGGNVSYTNDPIKVTLTHTLDKAQYDLPLTLKTYIPSQWTKVTVTQNKKVQNPTIQRDAEGPYILYQLTPNSTPAILYPDK